MTTMTDSLIQALRMTREAIHRLWAKPDVVTLKNGTELIMRPIMAGDEPLIEGIYRGMGPESLYQRFNAGINGDPSGEFLRHLAEQTVEDTLTHGKGFMAYVEDEPGHMLLVAKIRYVKVDDHAAEFAISVIDAFHSQGIGTALMRRLVKAAEADGIDNLGAYIQPDNHAMIRVVYKLGIPFEEEVEIDMLKMTLFLDTSLMHLV